MGALAVAYEEATDRILLVAEELIVPVDDEDEDGDDDLLESDLPDRRARRRRSATTRPPPASASPGRQVAGFIARAASLVLSGRPICPLCAPTHRPGRARLPAAQLTEVARSARWAP